MSGLIYTTRGWAGAAITYTHADGADTYTVTGDELNALDVAVALGTWLNAAGRPWAAHVSAVSLAVQTGTAEVLDYGPGRLRFAYTFTGSSFVSVAPNATWAARFGDGSYSPPTTAEATCSVEVASSVWQQWDTRPGLRSREGSMRAGHPLTSHRRPSCELPMSLLQSWAFSECARLAAPNRTAYVYDEAARLWRLCRVGQADTQHAQGGEDMTRVVGTLTILGLLDATIAEGAMP